MRPPPSYPPPPTPTPNIPAGYMVTVSGPPDQVLRQLRLLPLSASILCLPALQWTLAKSDHVSPSTSRRSSVRNHRLSRASTDTQRATSRQSRNVQDHRGSRQSTAEQLRPPTLAEIKASVLKLHQDYLQRYEQARRFLERERGAAEVDRRIVFFNGSERDAKAICIDGLRQGLRDDEEVERVWNEILDGGVEALVDGLKGPENHKAKRISVAESTVSSEGVKHSQNTERSSIGSRFVDPSLSPVRSLSASPSIGTAAATPTSRHGSEVGHATVIRFSRGRGDTVVQEHFISLPSPLPEEVESRSRSRSPAKSHGYGSGRDEPPVRTKRMDSTYSSSVDTAPPTRRRAEVPDAEIPILGSFKFEPEHDRGVSPSRSPRTDAESTVPSSLHVSTGDSDSFGDPLVEALFPNMREDVAIHLIPENPKERDQFVERLLATDASRRPVSYLASPLPSPSSPHTSFRTSSISPSLHISPPPFVIVPSKVFLFSDKSPLEVHNEMRAILMKYIPPTNSAADTPTSLEFPEAAKWLVDPENDMFTPIMAAGFEGLPDALCPGLDMIVAIGADGREWKDATLTDETERQAVAVSRVLASDIEQLGGRSNADSRGTRVTLKHLLQLTLPFLQCHPGMTIEDVAAGHLLIPCIEFCQKHNPNVRLLVIDFDLKTGSQAILGLRSLLPPEMFKLIVVGETVGINSTPHGHGNRIYVRTSVGKTTMSFSALPSTPLQKDRPKIRRLETAKMSVMARADVVASPWTDKESGDYRLAVALVTDGVRERRVLCGVIDTAPPRLVSSRDKDHHPPAASAPPPSSPLPPTPPLKDVKAHHHHHHHHSPPSPPRITRTPSPGTKEPIPTVARPRRASEPRKDSLPTSNLKPELHLKFADSTNTAPPPRFKYGEQDLSPLPHPGVVMAAGRRDSDTNSHGGGVSIASPTSLRPPTSPLAGGSKSPSDVKWQEGSYFDARMEDEAESDEYLSEDEIQQARQKRKGSKALRWLGIES